MPVRLSFRIESPPLVLYGKRTESTGALLSGQFTLEVLDETPFPMKHVYMAIIQEVHTVKAHSGQCKNCLNHTTELARWEVLQHPADLPKGSHAYPFSHLIPGSVPAATSNSVFTVEYRLTAVAVPDNDKHNIQDPNHPGQKMRFPNFVINLPLNIKRSIIRGPDRNSMRVFPPTDIVAQITLPSSVYPESSFPLEMVVEGISIHPDSGASTRQTRWRLKKLSWRLDEEAKIRAFRCPAHEHVPLSKYAYTGSSSRSSSTTRQSTRHGSPAVTPVAGPSRVPSSSSLGSSALRNSTGSRDSAPSSAASSPALAPQDIPADAPPPAPKEFFIEETRAAGSGELKNGWKTDFSGKGKVELLTEINTAMTKIGCDIDDPTFGLHVSHVLVLEIVVAEEALIAGIKTATYQVMPTGAARVLRMQFKLNMTERSGLGIAWDDEVPPTYADVPMSPPTYENVGRGRSRLPTVENVNLNEGSSSQAVRGINGSLDV